MGLNMTADGRTASKGEQLPSFRACTDILGSTTPIGNSSVCSMTISFPHLTD